MTGYALTAPCVIVFLSTVFHPIHDHIFFYALWIILGGLTAARMATAFASRAQEVLRVILDPLTDFISNLKIILDVFVVNNDHHLSNPTRVNVVAKVKV